MNIFMHGIANLIDGLRISKIKHKKDEIYRPTTRPLSTRDSFVYFLLFYLKPLKFPLALIILSCGCGNPQTFLKNKQYLHG